MASRIFNSAQYFEGEECQTFEHGVQRLSGDETTLLIDIRGFIKIPNTIKVRAAYGVYFGNDSSFNRNGVVPEHVPKNDQAAEIYAAIAALRTVKEFSLASDIKLLVLKVSSNYLPQHMEDTVFKWENNGYLNSWGQRVVHEELFRELQQQFLALENTGTEVKLWRVSRNLNKLRNSWQNMLGRGGPAVALLMSPSAMMQQLRWILWYMVHQNAETGGA